MFCIPIRYNIRDMTLFHGPWNSHERFIHSLL
jgi:hypothetical protein